GGGRAGIEKGGRRGRLRPICLARRDREADAGHRGAAEAVLTAWPPQYDPDYRPAADDPYWFREIECGRQDDLILRKLKAQVRYAWDKSVFYRRKWEAAGISPDTLRTLYDLARFPVVQNNELRASQAASTSFG